MLDKLLEFLSGIWKDIVPFMVIPYYMKGYRFRMGKKAGILEPGFHWKIPLVDEVISHMVKTTTMDISEQSLTTKDDCQVVVKSIVKYDVSDVEQLICEVDGPVEAVKDMTKGIIRDFVINRPWAECSDPKLGNEITKKARTEARKWGINIETVTITDLGKIRSIRLFNTIEKPEKEIHDQ